MSESNPYDSSANLNHQKPVGLGALWWLTCLFAALLMVPIALLAISWLAERDEGPRGIFIEAAKETDQRGNE